MLEGNRRYKGFLFAEVAVGLAVLGMILIGLAISLHAIAKFNRYQLTRQRCTSAARAQIDSIAATDRRIDDEEIERLWPGIDVAVVTTKGTDQWQGLELLEATAAGSSYGKKVEVKLGRYIIAQQEQ